MSLRDAITRLLGSSRSGPPSPPTRAEDERLNRRILIPAGSFQMGREFGVGLPDEHPAHSVRLSAFLMQQHEVTNEEYQRFDPSHSFATGRERHPATNINWHQAKAYAEWLGGSLPTEAQWEYAARGSEGRTYPWGEEPPTCEHAHFADCEPRSTVEVMSAKRGATPEGIYDLAGNVWEWTADWYGDYRSQAVTDPQGPPTGRFRVLRGGSFTDVAGYLRASDRGIGLPENGGGLFGFRVVWVSAGGQD